MQANAVFDAITAPVRGAQRAALIRAGASQVATLHLKDDNLAGRGASDALH